MIRPLPWSLTVREAKDLRRHARGLLPDKLRADAAWERHTQDVKRHACGMPSVETLAQREILESLSNMDKSGEPLSWLP